MNDSTKALIIGGLAAIGSFAASQYSKKAQIAATEKAAEKYMKNEGDKNYVTRKEFESALKTQDGINQKFDSRIKAVEGDLKSLTSRVTTLEGQMMSQTRTNAGKVPAP